MSSLLYYEPLYLNLVDGAFSSNRSAIPGAIPSGIPGGIPNVIPGGVPSVIPNVIPGIFPTTATQKPVDIFAAMKPLKPTMDLHEDIQQNVVTATFEFPGLSKEDVQIDLHAGKLIVSAETDQSEGHAENGYAVRERRFGKYSRTLQLPLGVKEEEVKASMENGVLTVTFPKLTPELVPRRISIF